MSNPKKLSLIAFILLLTGIVGSVVTFKSMNLSKEISEKVEFENDEINNIEIFSDNASIEIISVDDSKTKVEFLVTGMSKKEYTFDAKVNGDTLTIETEERFFQLLNFNFFYKDVEIKVYVPNKLYDSLKVDVANGRIDAKDLTLNKANISTVNGKIALKDLQSKKLEVTTTNGEIEMKNVEGDIIGETVNGHISLVTENLDRNLEFESVNGKIDIQTMKDPTNVSIETDVVLGETEIFGDSMGMMKVGNGDYKIHVSTVNGSITISK